jgi:hypothetical protein
MDLSDFQTSARVTIAATPVALYDMVADVTRMGDFSPENTGAVWEDGATANAGARFTGHNRRAGRDDWDTTCEILVADRPRELAWAVLGAAGSVDPGAQGFTQWTYRFTPHGDGTEVEERWELLRLAPRYLAMTSDEQQEVVDRARENMERTLRSLKDAAERA